MIIYEHKVKALPKSVVVYISKQSSFASEI